MARLAGALRGLGLQPGDRVGMLALNSDCYLEHYLVVYWADGCFMNAMLASGGTHVILPRFEPLAVVLFSIAPR